ncbi:hypothetical protein IT072_03585 [Leifsonia sp. ZF2019]|uniref:hypothetical protein n=1 Tax=Leifsonia sp. ZF2019 TaxID=2781978 RepID=UPI001CBC87FF|nr:hypothetical protein [Leifsonia sp. ZF2019]UAJ80141.1 hypothetical protein IT072_03585 [Leifsonia sp. ZF2019]
MPVEWSPVTYARPMEWFLRVSESQEPYAVVRRFLKGDPNRPEEWFRVVTYAPTSEGRELVGWVSAFEAACQLGWDYKCAYESWRHHMAKNRASSEAMSAAQPPAAELVRFYREHEKKREQEVRGAGPPAI